MNLKINWNASCDTEEEELIIGSIQGLEERAKESL